jgi:SAM-dependent methyltransferase
MTNGVAEHDAGSHWEDVAAEWTAWARAPEHDAFWAYRDEFRRFAPTPGRATLEIGCGEGRVARELTALGHHVTATDISRSLLSAARQSGSAERYVHADATSLPFENNSFDRVMAYNVLMDIPDMRSAVSEAARVLSPDGLLTISIVHPFSDRGHFATPNANSPFVVSGTYFGARHFSGIERRNGHVLHFTGWSHPLEDYMAALNDAGLAVTSLREPRPNRPENVTNAVRQWSRMPLFLWLNARLLP